MTGGEDALAGFGLEVGRPVLPMLASSAPDLAAAVAKAGGGRVAVDVKLDGIRIQVHRDGDEIRIATRTLEDITARLPEVVAVARELPAARFVLDGEALALDQTGRPRPFQETASRTAQSGGVAVTPYFFDLLHLDGADLLDAPGARPGGRPRAAGARAVPGPPAGHRRPRRRAGVPRRGAALPGTRGSWSRTSPRRTTPAAAAPRGSRSSPCTPSTWWCWRSSRAADGGRAGCPTSTSARATPRPAGS